MQPVRFAEADVVYRGPSSEIGDLYCQRIQPGCIAVVYELDDEDRARIAAGGRVLLALHTEPIPPISMVTIDESVHRPIGEHPFKVIEELDDPERQDDRHLCPECRVHRANGHLLGCSRAPIRKL